MGCEKSVKSVTCSHIADLSCVCSTCTSPWRVHCISLNNHGTDVLNRLCERKSCMVHITKYTRHNFSKWRAILDVRLCIQIWCNRMQLSPLWLLIAINYFLFFWLTLYWHEIYSAVTVFSVHMLFQILSQENLKPGFLNNGFFSEGKCAVEPWAAWRRLELTTFQRE